MTGYETTSLTLETVGLVLSALIGAGQIGVVWYGIRQMVWANENRASTQSAMMNQQEKNSQRRHDEAMTALKVLIERTGLRVEGAPAVSQAKGGAP